MRLEKAPALETAHHHWQSAAIPALHKPLYLRVNEYKVKHDGPQQHAWNSMLKLES